MNSDLKIDDGYEGILMQAPVGICVLEGKELIFSYVNDSYYKIIGYKKDLLNKKVREAFPEVEEQGYFEILDDVFLTGKTFEAKELPVKLLDKDDKISEVFVDVIYKPKRNKLGVIDGIITVVSDVTKHVESRKLLEAAERRTKFALESAQMGEWQLDLLSGSAYRSLKHDQIFGYQELLASWTYDDFLSHVHPEDKENVDQKFKSAFNGTSEWNFECRIFWPDGTLHWITSRARSDLDSAGMPVKMAGIVWDITDKKLTERALIDSLTVRDDFISMASHELKTPITSLKLQLQLIKRQLERSTENEFDLLKMLDSIKRSIGLSDRLTHLINDLLNVSHINSGQLSFTFETFDISTEIPIVISEQHEQLKASGCEISLNLSPGLNINADRFKMNQVFTNLLSNTFKYAPGQKITISSSPKKSFAEIIFHDSGPGIPKEYHEKIFEKFERLSNSSSASGMGLGLHIVREIISGHGGTISIDSEQTQGTKFIIHLPLLNVE